jgi:hypothetical protein
MAFSTEDQQLMRTLAQQQGISEGAVAELWRAVQAGNGTAAQFTHPELGGMGQWMAGGMVMVGDFSKPHLQSTVMQVCTAIAAHLQGQRLAAQSTPARAPSQQAQSQTQGQSGSGAQPSMQPRQTGAGAPRPPTGQGNTGQEETGKSRGLLSKISKKLFGGVSSAPERVTTSTEMRAASARGWSNWWPDELGSPNSSGSQNEMHYAYFAGTRRLALRIGSRVTIYDTGEHQIGGVSQQQGTSRTVTFSSQKGDVAVDRLKKIREYTL